MVSYPVAGDADPASQPNMVVVRDDIEQAGQCLDTTRMTHDARVQPDGELEELTILGIKPDRGRLAVIAERSGVVIVAGCDYYIEDYLASNTHVRKFSDMLLTFNRQAGASAPLASLDFARGPAVADLRISPETK